MPRLLRLSAKQVVAILNRFGFFVIRQKGSHMTLRRRMRWGDETFTVPNHAQLDIGTVKGIYNSARKFIAEEELRKYFYK